MKKGLWGYIGVLVPAVVAVISALVILNVHSASLHLSGKAGELNAGVNACRSIMDIYLAEGEGFTEALDAIGYEAVPEDNGYRLDSRNEGPDAEINIMHHGAMENITVTAYNGGTEVYCLQSSRYIGGE